MHEYTHLVHPTWLACSVSEACVSLLSMRNKYNHFCFVLSFSLELLLFFALYFYLRPVYREMKKWYVVYEGRMPGVYDEWEDCLKQVNKFKGNNYKGYKSKEEAEDRYLNHLLAKERK